MKLIPHIRLILLVIVETLLLLAGIVYIPMILFWDSEIMTVVFYVLSYFCSFLCIVTLYFMVRAIIDIFNCWDYSKEDNTLKIGGR